MRLRRIELLCLRAADGLASERDLETIRKAGIDPNEWQSLSSMISEALKPTSSIDIANEVCQSLEIESLPLNQALASKDPVNIVDAIMESVSLDVAAASQQEVQPIEKAVEDPLIELPQMEESDSLSLKSILMDTEPPPDICDDVLEAIAALDKPVEEVSEEEDVFVLDDFIEEPKVSEDLVLDIETDMELPIGEALKAPDTPNLTTDVMNMIESLGTPQPHLRLISNEKSFVNEELFEVDDDSDEQIGGVLIEIKDIKSPVEIDADMVIHRAALYAFSGAFAIAAAAILTFMLYDEKPNSVQKTPEPQSSIELASIDNSIDILELESDVTVQIIPPLSNNKDELTIIFIDDPEGE